MDEQSLNQVVKLIRTFGVQRREGQNDQSHNFFYGRAVDEATHQRVFREEDEPTAGSVVESGKGEGDEEVQQDTQHIGAGASVDGFRPQQTSGNHPRDIPPKQDAGLG